MKTPTIALGLFYMMLLSVTLAAAEPKLDLDKLPPPAAGKMDFVRDIQPIFERSCLRCHHSNRRKQAGAFRAEWLRLDVNRDAALELSGAIVPGHSEKSRLIHAAAGLDVTMLMPPTFETDQLPPREIGKLRAWIDQGAIWPEPHKLPDGFRLLNHLVKEEFPTDGGEQAWAAFVKGQQSNMDRQQRKWSPKSGLSVKLSLLISDNKAKMLVGGDDPDEPEFRMLPFIPPDIPSVRVFIPDLVNATVEVYTRGGNQLPETLTGKDPWKRVWSHAESGSSVLSPEIQVANNRYGDLEVRVISNKEGAGGVSNILVLAPRAAAKK